MGKFYAVRKGHKVGIFNTWNECQRNVSGFSGAEYKSFKTLAEAEDFLKLNDSNDSAEENNKFDEDYILAYVDGSYEESIGRYGSGVLLLNNQQIIKEISFGGCEEDLIAMRNVAGEIKAAEFAMKFCLDNDYRNLVIYHDYAGIEKWCTGIWEARKTGTINYRDAYKDFKSKGLNVRFIKVKAHSGNKFNDRADLLAKKGLEI